MWRAALYHALLTLLIGGIAALTVWAGTAAPEVPVTPPAGAAAGQETEVVQEAKTEAVIIISPKTGDDFGRWFFG